MFKNRGTRELVKGLMNLAFSLEKIGLMILMSVSIENGGKFLTVPLAGLPGQTMPPLVEEPTAKCVVWEDCYLHTKCQTRFGQGDTAAKESAYNELATFPRKSTMNLHPTSSCHMFGKAREDISLHIHRAVHRRFSERTLEAA